ncbi:hypothetical protein F4810DRAFT_600231 [Camillea tinctor]|nr:hypothetical protein F4810DRAFT_600231 [Camillea tinctor]
MQGGHFTQLPSLIALRRIGCSLLLVAVQYLPTYFTYILYQQPTLNCFFADSNNFFFLLFFIYSPFICPTDTY